MKKIIITLIFVTVTFSVFSQESNIKSYTPSKLLKKGDWDFKIFNNLYTQTKGDDAGVTKKEDRSNYFTTTLETYTGVSKNSRINVGLIVNVKSNTFFGKSATSVFSFGNDDSDAIYKETKAETEKFDKLIKLAQGDESQQNSLKEQKASALKKLDRKLTSKSGISSIGLSVKYQPFKNISNFSGQSTFYFPVFKDKWGRYLDKRSYVFENRYFYDIAFGNGNYQFFAELDFTYHFGEKSKDASADENSGERYANNSLAVPLSVFLSYFPSDNFTVYVNAQHYELFDLGNKFTQNYTLLGVGGKYQLSNALNLEISYGNFVRGRDNGLGQTFNLGLRYLLTR